MPIYPPVKQDKKILLKKYIKNIHKSQLFQAIFSYLRDYLIKEFFTNFYLSVDFSFFEPITCPFEPTEQFFRNKNFI